MATNLVTAAQKGDEEAVKALLAAGYKDLEEGLNLGGEEKMGEMAGECTALIFAATRGSNSIVQALLAAGANVNARAGNRPDGWTALFCAAYDGYEGCVRLLVQAGANKDLKDKNGDIAYKRAKTEAVRAILRP